MSNTNFEKDVIDRLARIETAAQANASHESRIRALESWRYYILGAAAAVAGIVSYIRKAL